MSVDCGGRSEECSVILLFTHLRLTALLHLILSQTTTNTESEETDDFCFFMTVWTQTSRWRGLMSFSQQIRFPSNGLSCNNESVQPQRVLYSAGDTHYFLCVLLRSRYCSCRSWLSPPPSLLHKYMGSIITLNNLHEQIFVKRQRYNMDATDKLIITPHVMDKWPILKLTLFCLVS